jgi:hypothetical protein
MRWVGKVACIEEKKKCTAFSGLNPKESECVQESIILKRILNIQDGIHLAQKEDDLRALMNTPGTSGSKIVWKFFDCYQLLKDSVACGLRLYVFGKESNTQSRCLEVRMYKVT